MTETMHFYEFFLSKSCFDNMIQYAPGDSEVFCAKAIRSCYSQYFGASSDTTSRYTSRLLGVDLIKAGSVTRDRWWCSNRVTRRGRWEGQSSVYMWSCQ